MGFSRQEYWSGVPLPSKFNLFVVNSDDLNQISLFLTSILKTWVEFGINERAGVFVWLEYYPIILSCHVNYLWRLPEHSTFFSIKVKYWTALLTKRTELTFIKDKCQRQLDNTYFFQEHFKHSPEYGHPALGHKTTRKQLESHRRRSQTTMQLKQRSITKKDKFITL